MPRTMHRLTAVKVANLRDKGLHPDGNGLYLRITATGTKSWIWRFSRAGASHDMGLGPLTTVSLAKARELAADARRLRHQGLDPVETRNAQRKAQAAASTPCPTFRQCAERLIASHETSWRNAKHRAQWPASLQAYAYPVIGDLPVTDVDTTLVLRIPEPIWAIKPETAGRVRGRIEAVLDWARARALREGQNAAQWRGHLDHILPPRSKMRRVRHHPALPHAEIPMFMGELRSCSGIGARALQFVILTAARTGEGLGARWSEIDLAQKLWIIPAERMKAGRAHKVPLSAAALRLLNDMFEIRQNEFVFAGMKHGRPLSNMALLMLLRDLRPGITVHGFRSTFKDWAAETTSFPDHISEMALAHASGDKVRDAYQRTDLLAKRRSLLEAWAGYCEQKPTSAVVAFRR